MLWLVFFVREERNDLSIRVEPQIAVIGDKVTYINPCILAQPVSYVMAYRDIHAIQSYAWLLNVHTAII